MDCIVDLAVSASFLIFEDLHGVVAKMLDYDIIELLPCYYIFFRANSIRKGMIHHIPRSYELNSITTVLQQGWLWHKITHESWYVIKQRLQAINILLGCITWVIEWAYAYNTKPEILRCVRLLRKKTFDIFFLLSKINKNIFRTI